MIVLSDCAVALMLERSLGGMTPVLNGISGLMLVKNGHAE